MQNDIHCMKPDIAVSQVTYSTDGINSNVGKWQHTFGTRSKVNMPNMNLLTTNIPINLQDVIIYSSL